MLSIMILVLLVILLVFSVHIFVNLFFAAILANSDIFLFAFWNTYLPRLWGGNFNHNFNILTIAVGLIAYVVMVIYLFKKNRLACFLTTCIIGLLFNLGAYMTTRADKDPLHPAVFIIGSIGLIAIRFTFIFATGKFIDYGPKRDLRAKIENAFYATDEENQMELKSMNYLNIEHPIEDDAYHFIQRYETYCDILNLNYDFSYIEFKEIRDDILGIAEFDLSDVELSRVRRLKKAVLFLNTKENRELYKYMHEAKSPADPSEDMEIGKPK